MEITKEALERAKAKAIEVKAKLQEHNKHLSNKLIVANYIRLYVAKEIAGDYSMLSLILTIYEKLTGAPISKSLAQQRLRTLRSILKDA